MSTFSLTTIMDGIASQITSQGIMKSAHGYPHPNPTAPCAIVAYPTRLNWMTDKMAEAEFPVYFIVGKVEDKSARDALSKIIDGSNSIKANLEGTLGGSVSSCQVLDIVPEPVISGDVEYLAAKATLSIYA